MVTLLARHSSTPSRNSRLEHRIGLRHDLAHGYVRNTLDVDCLVAMENDPVMAEELTKAGFECFEEQTSFRRFRHRNDPLIVLDVCV